MSKLANARNALIAEAAFAFFRDRLAGKVPGVEPRRRRGRKLLLGGVLGAVAAGLLLKHDRVKALLPGGRSPAAPPPPPAPPAPSNYDVSGPVANTATPVPAPDPVVPEAIDEDAEEAAAGAEAANIGGPGPDYAKWAELAAAERPPAPARQPEPQEQPTADLPAAAEPPADAAAPEKPQDEKPGASQQQTWSGRSINP